ncbi:MAG TPA: outer membrane beta-barrel protein [Bdellovibrionales bacterium]|nr:outer membrane beta-barrel protein [Bdellovibrionales bacterium]
MRSRFLLPICGLLFGYFAPVVSHAGVFEIGASGTYRRSVIAADSFDESKSLTGSVSYYFTEASAIELSYTDGTSKREIVANNPNSLVTKTVTNLTYRTLGLDFVFTLGPKEATLRPYLKAGVNYILEKRYFDQTYTAAGPQESTVTEDPAALVPSGGAGLTLRLSQTLSLKFGIDAWTSRPLNSKPVTIDYAGRAGISWLL